MTTQKWWEESITHQFSTSDGWTFGGSITDVPAIKAFASFDWSLSLEQTTIAAKLINEDKLVQMRYTSWAQFCLVNGIAPSATTG